MTRSDGLVTARVVLRAAARVKRGGVERTMAELERREPELAEFVFEQLSACHERLMRLGAPYEQTQRLYRRVERLVLTVVMAAGEARAELLLGLADPGAEERGSDPVG